MSPLVVRLLGGKSLRQHTPTRLVSVQAQQRSDDIAAPGLIGPNVRIDFARAQSRSFVGGVHFHGAPKSLSAVTARERGLAKGFAK